MFEDKYAEDVILKIPSSTIVDGQRFFVGRVVKALIIDFTEHDLNYFGQIKNGKIFLLKSAYEPLPDSRIVHAGKTYDLKGVKVCCDLDERIECYRCAAAF